MKRIGQLVFVGAFSLALALYWLTAPDGLPWNDSTHLALAYLGEIVRLPSMPHPVWGCYVQVFGGAVALSAFMAAVAAGLIALLVNRYFGWRFAASAALVWIFLPSVWNRAITGERDICLVAMTIVAVWALDGVARRVLRKAREVRTAAKKISGGLIEAALPSAEAKKKRERVNCIAGRVALGVAGLFAVVSLTIHDYRYGVAAGVFAKGVVEEALLLQGCGGQTGEGVIVLNGVVDDQVVRELESRVGERSLASDSNLHVIFLRSDDAYRTNLLVWVRSCFPNETNLWVAAQVGVEAFVEAAARTHPARFYLMDGKSTTLEGWEKRWEAFKPYLTSRDPFVPVARRLFGYEGNAVANAMLDEGEKLESRGGVGERRTTSGSAAQPVVLATREHTPSDACSRVASTTEESGLHSPTPTHDSNLSATLAWQMYKLIYTEVDPGNISALVNMSEMIRLGYAVSGDERKRVEEALEKFFRDAFNRRHARAIARAAGPIRADPDLFEKMAAEAKKRIVAKIAAGEKVEFRPEFLSLVEWNNEMVRLTDRGELSKAGCIARAILSNPMWRGFIPANAVMGSVAAKEGDYVSSAAFFRIATDTTNAVPVVVLNDYADTLNHLGRIEEAEKLARRAVKESEESFWVARLTLAEVLEKKIKVGAQGQEREVDETAPNLNSAETEILALLKSVLKYAPAKVRDGIRKEHWKYVR